MPSLPLFPGPLSQWRSRGNIYDVLPLVLPPLDCSALVVSHIRSACLFHLIQTDTGNEPGGIRHIAVVVVLGGERRAADATEPKGLFSLAALHQLRYRSGQVIAECLFEFRPINGLGDVVVAARV